MKKIVILLMSVLILLSLVSCQSLDDNASTTSLTLGSDMFIDGSGMKAGGAFTFEYLTGKPSSPVSYASRMRLAIPLAFNKRIDDLMSEHFYVSFDEDIVYTKKLGVPNLHVGGGAGISPVIGANVHAVLGLGFDLDEKREIAFMTYPALGYNFMPYAKDNRWYFGLTTNICFKFLQDK